MKKIVLAIFLLFIANQLISQEYEILGAGATFPYPLYSKMFYNYEGITKIKVNYQGIGSGGGIQQLISKTVDFGGTDAPLTKSEEKAAGAEVIHIPTCLGAVVLAYNLPGNPKLNFTPEVIVDIFLGKIKFWNDEKIKQINEGIELPNMPIIVVRRSDGSGTTYTFSDYLCAVSKEWESKVGKGKSLNWPTGIGAKGNDGVAGYIRKTPGAIGYIELSYAKQNKMSYGRIKNKSGNFIDPDLESISLAANIDIAPDTKVSLVNTSAEKGYPIVTFTWIIFYKEQSYGGRDISRVRNLVNLFWWMIHDGQNYTEALDYGKLPPKVITLAENLIKSVTYDGKRVFKQ